MKLLYMILDYLSNIILYLSESCMSDKNGIAKIFLLIFGSNIGTPKSWVKELIGLSTLLLNLIIIIGIILDVLDNPSYVFLIITSGYCTFSLILYFLYKISQPSGSFLYIIIFWILTLLCLIMIQSLFFPSKPSTYYLPNPTPLPKV